MDKDKFNRRKRYTLNMDNEIFTRSNISLVAKGVLATLFALDIEDMDWNDELSENDGVVELLQKVCCEPKDEILKAIFELELLGYIEWFVDDPSFSIFYDTSEIKEIYDNYTRDEINTEILNVMQKRLGRK